VHGLSGLGGLIELRGPQRQRTRISKDPAGAGEILVNRGDAMELVGAATRSRVGTASVHSVDLRHTGVSVMKKTIALVEDDEDQRENCADALRAHGYRVRAHERRLDALEAFAAELPDLTILDVILGDEVNGGFDLGRELLVRAPDHPIIFLTTRVDEISQVSGLTLGAWDYLPKPVSLRVLAEKVGTLLRLADMRVEAASSTAVVAVGELTMDEGRMQVRWRGEALDLTLTEFRVLEALVRRGGRVATYGELMDSAMQGVVSRNTVNTHVLHLRKKFRALDPAFDAIRNEYALGYRWQEA
jgi:two-component system OmpR family response regulator